MNEHMVLIRNVLVSCCVVFVGATSAFAQGNQTGTLRGVVRDEQGLPIAGVTVTLASPALQGGRSLVSADEGSYSLRALPPGDYSVTFERSGFATRTEDVTLSVGLDLERNVMLVPAGRAETVQVTAGAPAVISAPVVGANFQRDEIEDLANPRTLQGIAQLSPGLTENSPNVRQLVINGAFAFDNVFQLNGVDVNDNLLAQPQDLFIEDAIQETQVLTSGISAEYGRFTGGVVNAITKSGGNTFAGTFRMNLLNPAWSDETPFEKSRGIERLNDLQVVYEGTLGGPIVRDRLWFFSAGRYQNTQASNTLPVTAIAYTRTDRNKRGEIKLTGTIAPNQTIQGGYVNNSLNVQNTGGAVSLLIDRASLDNQHRPNSYYFTNYRGVLRDKFLAEAQYSQRRFAFEGLGGTSTNIVDSPFLALTLGPPFPSVYNAPLGDATDPERRNNREFTSSLTSFWNKAGRHEIKGGYDFFRSQRTSTGTLSATGYYFETDYATDAAGRPVLDASGRLSPLFVPGETLVEFLPLTRGPVMNVDSHSLYVQDHWALNDHWSADIGARFEQTTATSTGDIVSVDAGRIVPRLAAAYDVQGNGNHIVHVTYGQYSGRYNENQIGANSPVGHTADITMLYAGPAGQGRGFAPGFDIKNYRVLGATDPTGNVFMDPDLHAPLVHELTTSYGANLWNGRGYAEATYVYRKTTNLIEDFKTIAGGFTDVVTAGVDVGLSTNQIFMNTDLAHREYQGMVFQSRFRISRRWSVNGHYTVQLKNDGNYEGEAANNPGQTSFIGNYPEAFNAARNFPDGHLQSFQRHRLRIWSLYDVGMGRFGDLSVSGLWRVDSGRVYSLRAASQPLTSIQASILRAAGYPDQPGTADPSLGYFVYFGDRGSERFKGYGLFDMSFNYAIPLFRSMAPWLKADIFNVFNNDKLISWNTTVRQDPASTKDSLGLATGYVRGASFGQATSTANFPAPFNGADGGRTFRLAFGLRF